MVAEAVQADCHSHGWP